MVEEEIDFFLIIRICFLYSIYYELILQKIHNFGCDVECKLQNN